MPILSLEAQSKLAQWRQRSREGTITLEEQIAAVRLMRGERFSAAQAAAAGKTKRAATAAAKAPVDGNSLLDEMMGGDL